MTRLRFWLGWAWAAWKFGAAVLYYPLLWFADSVAVGSPAAETVSAVIVIWAAYPWWVVVTYFHQQFDDYGETPDAP